MTDDDKIIHPEVFLTPKLTTEDFLGGCGKVFR